MMKRIKSYLDRVDTHILFLILFFLTIAISFGFGSRSTIIGKVGSLIVLSIWFLFGLIILIKQEVPYVWGFKAKYARGFWAILLVGFWCVLIGYSIYVRFRELMAHF
jgi:hypothetical protein